MGKVTCAADLYEIESQERSCSNKGVESSRYVPYSRAKTEADADVAVEVVVEGGTGGFDIEGEVDASDDNNKNTLRSTDTDTDTDTLPPQQRLLEEYSYSGPLANVTGYQSKSLQNLFQAIESRRILPMYRFIYGIGLRYVGLNTCKLLEREFGSFQEFWNMVTDPSRGGLANAVTVTGVTVAVTVTGVTVTGVTVTVAVVVITVTVTVTVVVIGVTVTVAVVVTAVTVTVTVACHPVLP